MFQGVVRARKPGLLVFVLRGYIRPLPLSGSRRGGGVGVVGVKTTENGGAVVRIRTARYCWCLMVFVDGGGSGGGNGDDGVWE